MPRIPTPASRNAQAEAEDYFAATARREKQTFAVGDLVRLAPDVGTKAAQRLVYRVTELRSVKGRTDYALEPVEGGRGSIAQAVHLDPASAADKARYANTPRAERLYAGSVVVAANGGLRGVDPFTKLVVLAENTDGTVKLAVLGGDEGRYYAKIPARLLMKINP